MKEQRRSLGVATRVQRFLKSDDPKAGMARDILWVLGVVGGVALLLFLVSGTWPAVVAVESGSMVPNMNVGDLVFVAAADRYGPLTSWAEGQEAGYAKFATYPDLQGNQVYGDVIIYKPNGDTSVNPIIHRAVVWYDNTTTPGYITKGDNNPTVDQDAYYQDIGYIQPVKKEWIVGKALFAIPLVGYLPLHIIEFAAVIIVLLIIWEWYSRRREEKEGDGNDRTKSAPSGRNAGKTGVKTKKDTKNTGKKR
ncbi:S24/S26 family peptidase [Methanogenium organophilum]|uniref:S26 family signal peptidase n=1 Tax=Methanogenium organophilum TaxID=2199 RepID=A0A9X9S6X0_METOG|nr:S26 family signal peptidase [Methanogenium organophilum]WAI02520.1 S26 family signal peptidase [Methanogenium organophilum]